MEVQENNFLKLKISGETAVFFFSQCVPTVEIRERKREGGNKQEEEAKESGKREGKQKEK